ncbi:uncharacterized protein LOC112543111, partial [Python bivittatus]|uniref:Uncharacterized protein LOC112543111 n=1 Tax=Python bivittatus TaxID=176946 RepID=A0A9F5N0E6_PYTBI
GQFLRLNCNSTNKLNQSSLGTSAVLDKLLAVLVLAVPSDHRWLVRGIQTQLEICAGLDSQPDPSVLIALNLAEDHNLSVITQLVQQIKETAGTGTMPEMRSFYITQLIEKNHIKPKESCSHYFSISAKLTYLSDTTGSPKTTYYQLALDTLALCVEKSPELERAASALANASLHKCFQFQGRFSVGKIITRFIQRQHRHTHIRFLNTILNYLFTLSFQGHQDTNPSKFSFQTEETSWGPMVTSINGLQASTNEKTYWQFLSGKEPLEQAWPTALASPRSILSRDESALTLLSF